MKSLGLSNLRLRHGLLAPRIGVNFYGVRESVLKSIAINQLSIALAANAMLADRHTFRRACTVLESNTRSGR